MLGKPCAFGVSGVIFGMPGDGHNLMRKVDLDKDTIPHQFLAQHIGGDIRLGINDCNPCFDHNGTRWEDVGLPYPDCCSILNISFIGNIGN